MALSLKDRVKETTAKVHPSSMRRGHRYLVVYKQNGQRYPRYAVLTCLLPNGIADGGTSAIFDGGKRSIPVRFIIDVFSVPWGTKGVSDGDARRLGYE